MKLSWARKIWISSWQHLSWVFPGAVAKWAQDLFLTPQRVPRPTSEEAFYQTARKFTLNEGIAAYEWGLSENPLVVLVHGWSGRGTQMGAFAEPLVQRGFRVVALDGPAHGASSGAQTNVGDYARFLIAAQQELGHYTAIVAHSFGSGCSVVAASRGLKVDKLIMIAGPAHYGWVVEGFLQVVRLSPGAKKRFYGSLAKKVGIPAQELHIGRIGNQLQIPALIVHDEGDKEVAYKSALELQEAWPEAELLTTQGLGHRRILKAPHVVIEVAEFIARGR